MGPMEPTRTALTRMALTRSALTLADIITKAHREREPTQPPQNRRPRRHRDRQCANVRTQERWHLRTTKSPRPTRTQTRRKPAPSTAGGNGKEGARQESE